MTKNQDSRDAEGEEESSFSCWSHPQYGEKDYWDRRYRRQPGFYDWYLLHNGLREIFNVIFSRDGHLLQLGVGTSQVQESMAKDGYTSILSVDYSDACIQRMEQVHRDLKALAYELADARHLPYSGSSFDGIFEKGMLDTILCGQGSAENAAKVLGEAHRVLKDGQALAIVSYGEPQSRLRHFLEKLWDVDVYSLTRPAPNMASEDAYLQEVVVQAGPFKASDTERMSQLSGPQYSHFVYVLWKKQ